MTTLGGHGLRETTNNNNTREKVSEKKSPKLKPRAAHSGYGSREKCTIMLYYIHDKMRENEKQ